MTDCDRCHDNGTIARSVRDGSYRCAGPVPDYAKGVYEAFCDCVLGQQLLCEEIAHKRKMEDIITKAKSNAHPA
jgi:hypothetical protein